jgi:hypothetical protein
MREGSQGIALMPGELMGSIQRQTILRDGQLGEEWP